ncbi:Teichuronic acid biosynthesis protein TuaB [Aliarcobacter thereius]|uniref:lipopolysaccharide biosynthesis protein n=1 Tax=Aliarcobacter thereius TaxID=544718 RepID=UPI000828E58A|nr:lipopolysaccharide biosynthesis protein [Aliarcobacter thereius]OCL87040.1 Teichuronic acid biosynthesis protein TuaB [Aliarcobacter thereius]
MNKSLKSKAIHGLSWSLADKLINQLGSLAVTIYLARLIGPESFGFIGMLMIFMLLAESVISGGFMQALVQRSKDLTDADSSTIFYVNMLWGLAMYVLLYISAPYIAEFYRQPVLEEISRILFLVVIINSLSIVARAKLTIAIDFKSQTIASTFATLFGSILAIYLAFAEYGYWALVWLILSKALLNTITLWFFCRWFPSLVFSKYSLKSLFKFGSNLMIAGFVATFVNNLYVALVGRYFSATSVGYFTQSVNLTNALSGVISSTLQGVTYPIMTSVKEDKERLVNIYKQLISITMLFSLPVLVGFAAIADSFVKLFLGEEWLLAIPLIVALSFARTITPISAINMNILNAIGRSDLFLKVDLSKLPMSLIALFVAIPFGIEALALAMVCTSYIAFFINAYYPYKLFDFGPIKQLKIAFNYILASCIMYFVVIFIGIGGEIFELILKIVVGVIVYILFLWLRKDEFFMKIVGEVMNKIKLKRSV